MPEDTTGVQTEPDAGSSETVIDEGFPKNQTTGATTDPNMISKDKWAVRTLLPYVNKVLLWVYRLVFAILLFMVVITFTTALVVGVIAAFKQLSDDVLDVFSEPDLLAGALSPIVNSTQYPYFVVAIAGFVAGYLFMQGQYRKTFGIWFRPQKDSRQLPIERLVSTQKGHITEESLNDFADRYAKAWCSQDAASVAGFFSTNGSLKVNDRPRAVGRVAIADVAQDFMTAFPDMRVLMDDLRINSDRSAVFSWTLVGTNTGPGGSGNPIKIRGHEVWKIGDDGLIAKSRGQFDRDDYQRQLGIDVE